MTIVDAAIGVGIVIAFIYIIVMRMQLKYPKLGNFLAEFNPAKLTVKEIPTKEREVRQQTWQEIRSTI